MAWTVFALVHTMAGAVVWSTAVANHFERNRGAALAVMLCGAGVFMAIVPPFAYFLMDAYGWRSTLFGISACIALFVLPLVWLCLPESLQPAAGVGHGNGTEYGGAPAAPVRKTGLMLREAVRTLVFWNLGAALSLAGAAISTLVVHLQPILIDSGMPGSEAARAAASAG